MQDRSYWKRAVGLRLSRRHLLAAGTAAAAVAGISAVGCLPSMGGGEQSIEEMMRSDTTKKAKPGGVYTNYSGTDLPSVDPNRSSNFYSQTMAGFCYSRLLRYETGPKITPATKTVGDAALSAEASDQGQTWTFRLREGMRFHPRGPASVNGRALDAEDVSASFSYFLSANSGRKILEDLVVKLETPDTKTVVIKLKEPYAPFQDLIASPSLFWIMSKEAATGQVDSQKPEGVIGTGPWMLDSVRPGDGVQWVRQASFYERAATAAGERSLPLLDGFKCATIADAKELQVRFLAGDLNELGVANGDILDFVKQNPALPRPFSGPPAWSLSMHFFNLDNPSNIFRDERMRRALSMAFDRDALIQNFGNISALQAAGYSLESGWNNSPIPWGSGGLSWWLDPRSAAMGYPDSSPGKWYRYSPADVTALLSAAGHGGEAFDVETTSVAYGPPFDAMAQAQNAMVASAGLKANFAPADYRTSYLPEVFTKGNYRQVGFGLMTAFTTVDEYLFNMLLPEGARNLSKVNDPEITALVRKQRLELDFNKRQQLIYDIQKRCSDMMYYVPSVLSRWGGFTAVKASVRNMAAYRTAGFGMGVETVPHVWLDEKRA